MDALCIFVPVFGLCDVGITLARIVQNFRDVSEINGRLVTEIQSLKDEVGVLGKLLMDMRDITNEKYSQHSLLKSANNSLTWMREQVSMPRGLRQRARDLSNTTGNTAVLRQEKAFEASYRRNDFESHRMEQHWSPQLSWSSFESGRALREALGRCNEPIASQS